MERGVNNIKKTACYADLKLWIKYKSPDLKADYSILCPHRLLPGACMKCQSRRSPTFWDNLKCSFLYRNEQALPLQPCDTSVAIIVWNARHEQALL